MPARIVVTVAAVVGMGMSAVGLFIAIAVGMPALGFNAYGRNPAQFTYSSLSVAAALYLVGALLTVLAVDWSRRRGFDRSKLLPAAGFLGLLWLVVEAPLVLRRDWPWAAALLFFYVGILLPIAIGLRPWSAPPRPAEEKPAA